MTPITRPARRGNAPLRRTRSSAGPVLRRSCVQRALAAGRRRVARASIGAVTAARLWPGSRPAARRPHDRRQARVRSRARTLHVSRGVVVRWVSPFGRRRAAPGSSSPPELGLGSPRFPCWLPVLIDREPSGAQPPYSSFEMSPAENAIATACARLRAPSLSWMCRTCERTVWRLTNSSPAMPSVERPRATNARTSSSRAESTHAAAPFVVTLGTDIVDEMLTALDGSPTSLIVGL
jgi:hypothetical protein